MAMLFGGAVFARAAGPTLQLTAADSTISFSQNDVALGVGQSMVITLFGASGGTFYVSANSNPSAVTATTTGGSLSVYGVTTGRSTITVCGNYLYTTLYTSSCGVLSVTVGSPVSGNIWFEPSNPTMFTGQSLAVSINSGTMSNGSTAAPVDTSSYHITSNSNSGVVRASVSGTILNLTALQNGSTNITVSHSSLDWSGTLHVTVSGGGSNTTITFSNSNPVVVVGQSTAITIFSSNGSGDSFYVSSNPNPNSVSANINGQILTLYGMDNGMSSLSICQNNSPACGSVFVTVTGSVYGTQTYANGQLLNHNGTIYIVYKNTVRGFSNSAAFLGLGFNFNNAMGTDVMNQTMGAVISTAKAVHPSGSWIKSGQTVYFVHETGLIPIPSYDIFLNNGGRIDLLYQ